MAVETIASYNGGTVRYEAEVDTLTDAVTALVVTNDSDEACRAVLDRSIGDTMNRLVEPHTTYRKVLTVPIADGLDELGLTRVTRLGLSHPAG